MRPWHRVLLNDVRAVQVWRRKDENIKESKPMGLDSFFNIIYKLELDERIGEGAAALSIGPCRG